MARPMPSVAPVMRATREVLMPDYTASSIMALVLAAMTQPRYVFACPRGHKGAVDGGRYWTAARCPTCKSPVDRFRLARLRQWMGGTAPRSRLRIGKVVLAPLDGLAWLLVIFLLGVL